MYIVLSLASHNLSPEPGVPIMNITLSVASHNLSTHSLHCPEPGVPSMYIIQSRARSTQHVS